MLTLLRIESDRVGEDGKNYIDFVLAWRDEKGVVHRCRIRPCFMHDYWLLANVSVFVPRGELVEKYVG